MFDTCTVGIAKVPHISVSMYAKTETTLFYQLTVKEYSLVTFSSVSQLEVILVIILYNLFQVMGDPGHSQFLLA